MDSLLIKIEKGKIINSFCVVGLDENKLTKYVEEKEYPYIQNIDAVQQTHGKDERSIKNSENEEWILINKSMNCYLRIQYTNEYKDPITEFKIVECEYESTDYLLLSKKYYDQNYRPIIYSVLKSSNKNNSILSECPHVSPYNDFYVKIPAFCDVKESLLIPVKSQGAVILISRNKGSLPLKKIIVQPKPEKNTYQFGLFTHKSPYLSKYVPEILCSYPQEQLDSGIAMFNFPEGISIKTSNELPTWHNFVKTDELGQRKYGASFVFYEEMCNDLIENFIPIYKDKSKKYYYQKAICLLSNHPFFYNMNQFLKQLYQLQVSSKTKIPLERAICSFVDSLYLQSFDKSITFNFGEELNFYRIPYYGYEWDTKDECLNTMFHLLSYENIIIAWEAVLLEKKIFILSTSKQALLHICMGLITLIFPFQWIHTFIPLLPEKLKVFASESIFPEIMGINFPINLDDLPNDAIILNVDKNRFENYLEKLPKLPGNLKNYLMKKLNKIKPKYNIDCPKDVKFIMDSLDYVSPLQMDVKKIVIDSSEIRDIFYDFFIHLFKNYEKYFDWKKLQSKINDPKISVLIQKKEEPVPFLKDVFLKEFSSKDEYSFLNLFTQTSLFGEFIESFKYIDPYSTTAFFLESIKKGRESKYYLPDRKPKVNTVIPYINISDLKGKEFFYRNFPNKLDSKYIENFEKKRIPKPYRSRIKYTPDEWCYDIQKLSNREWSKFLMYSIYEIWYTLFSFVIHFYDDKKCVALMDNAINNLDNLLNSNIIPSKNLLTKLVKSCGRNSLAKKVKLILKKIPFNVKSNDTKLNSLFHNAFMNGLYTISENISNLNFPSLTNSTLNLANLRQSMVCEMTSNETVKKLLEDVIFLTYEMCPICIKSNKKPKKITIEQILAGFSRGKSDYSSVCPNCFNKIFPKIYFLKKSQQNLEAQNVNFLSPLVLVKEIDNIIKNHSEVYFFLESFYQDNYQRHIFWNLVFYFKLFNLPTFVLYIDNKDEQYVKIKKEIFDIEEEKKQYKTSPEKKKRRPSINSGSRRNSNASDTASVISERTETISLYETKLWEEIQKKIGKTYNYNNEAKGSEDRNDINSRIKDMKKEISKIIEIFVTSSKKKLDKFFDLLDKSTNNIKPIDKNFLNNKENELLKNNKFSDKSNNYSNLKKNNTVDFRFNQKFQKKPNNEIINKKKETNEIKESNIAQLGEIKSSNIAQFDNENKNKKPNYQMNQMNFLNNIQNNQNFNNNRRTLFDKNNKNYK